MPVPRPLSPTEDPVALVAKRLIKGVVAGSAVGVEGLGRYLSEEQQRAVVEQLSAEAARRGEALIADAHAVAAAIVAEAETQAAARHAQAYAEGFAAGMEAGHAEGQAQLAPPAALLRRAADAAAELRGVLLEGLEEQAVAFALAVARRVVGAAAETQATLAADLVAAAIHGAASRVLRVHVHPDDAEPVRVALLALGEAIDVRADNVIEVGGCILDLEGGSVDLRLGVQLDVIEGAFAPETRRNEAA